MQSFENFGKLKIKVTITILINNQVMTVLPTTSYHHLSLDHIK